MKWIHILLQQHFNLNNKNKTHKIYQAKQYQIHKKQMIYYNQISKMKSNVKRIDLIQIKYTAMAFNRLSRRKINLLMIKKIRKCFKIYSKKLSK
jgi:hypothetical protein